LVLTDDDLAPCEAGITVGPANHEAAWQQQHTSHSRACVRPWPAVRQVYMPTSRHQASHSLVVLHIVDSSSQVPAMPVPRAQVVCSAGHPWLPILLMAQQAPLAHRCSALCTQLLLLMTPAHCCPAVLLLLLLLSSTMRDHPPGPGPHRRG
jgi:hypothetical protein